LSAWQARKSANAWRRRREPLFFGIKIGLAEARRGGSSRPPLGVADVSFRAPDPAPPMSGLGRQESFATPDSSRSSGRAASIVALLSRKPRPC
jgi:hypothetical protein